jgi:hypothetical protein
MTEWISAKDRLPKRACMVLVYVEWGRMFDAWFASGIWYEFNKNGEMVEFDGVTHWVPLPKRPE